jgi:hypothetical protein
MDLEIFFADYFAMMMVKILRLKSGLVTDEDEDFEEDKGEEKEKERTWEKKKERTE